MAVTGHLSYLSTAVSSLCVAAVHDLVTPKVMRWSPSSGIGIFALLNPALSDGAQALQTMLAGVVAGAPIVLCYLARAMGAGDVRLLPAIGCSVRVELTMCVVLASSFSGALLRLRLAAVHANVCEPVQNVIALIVRRGRGSLVEHPKLNAKQLGILRLPHALSIALQSVNVFCTTAFECRQK